MTILLTNGEVANELCTSLQMTNVSQGWRFIDLRKCIKSAHLPRRQKWISPTLRRRKCHKSISKTRRERLSEKAWEGTREQISVHQPAFTITGNSQSGSFVWSKSQTELTYLIWMEQLGNQEIGHVFQGEGCVGHTEEDSEDVIVAKSKGEARDIH